MLDQDRNQALVVSCNNHERFLWMALREYQVANDGALPYEEGMPGYGMLCLFSATNTKAKVNCNHGAPNSRIGGWQAVNLSPEEWFGVTERWDTYREGKPIPFAWCGKPTHTGTRVVTGIASRTWQDGAQLHHFNMAEEEVRASVDALNRILDDIGERPVALNLPDGIDWSRWEVDRDE
jgi:hypothetical protein